MTPQQFVGLGVRLFAVWLVLSGLGLAATTMRSVGTAAFGMPPTTFSPWMLGPSATLFLAALVLWFFPMTISHRIVPRTSYENRLDASALDVGRIGIALLGLWLLAQHVPPLIGFFVRGLFVVGEQAFFATLGPGEKVFLVGTFIQVLIGFVLFVRATQLALLILGRRSEVAENRNGKVASSTSTED